MADSNIRLNFETKSILDALKPEFTKKFPDTYISYDSIINQLLHTNKLFNDLNDPKRKEQKKKEILQDYVPREDYDTVRNEKIEFRNQIEELREKLEKLEKIEKDFNADLINIKERHQNEINDLNNELVAKQTQLSLSNQKGNELTKEILALEINLKDLQDKYAKCSRDYTYLKRFNSEECITFKELKMMHILSCFLHRTKYKKFTIGQLETELVKSGLFDYEDTLSIRKIFDLHKYFLSIECLKLGGEHYFRFNKSL